MEWWCMRTGPGALGREHVSWWAVAARGGHPGVRCQRRAGHRAALPAWRSAICRRATTSAMGADLQRRCHRAHHERGAAGCEGSDVRSTRRRCAIVQCGWPVRAGWKASACGWPGTSAVPGKVLDFPEAKTGIEPVSTASQAVQTPAKSSTCNTISGKTASVRDNLTMLRSAALFDHALYLDRRFQYPSRKISPLTTVGTGMPIA